MTWGFPQTDASVLAPLPRAPGPSALGGCLGCQILGLGEVVDVHRHELNRRTLARHIVEAVKRRWTVDAAGRPEILPQNRFEWKGGGMEDDNILLSRGFLTPLSVGRGCLKSRHYLTFSSKPSCQMKQLNGYGDSTLNMLLLRS